MPAQGRTALLWGPSASDASLPPQVSAAGWEIVAVTELDAAREALDRLAPLVGIARLRGPDRWSCRAFEDLLVHSDLPEWVAVIEPAYLHSSAFCRLAAAGLFDFHTVPLDVPRFLHTLGHAGGVAALRREHRARVGAEPRPSAEAMIGTSPSMRALTRAIAKIARVSAPVLITGESGVGKEVTARAIHRQSARAGGRFVPVNCGALPDSLIAAELFGYEKGAFTGAYRRKFGRLEAAAGGSAFLDEIGELPLEQQVKLLRFLQDGSIDRIGALHGVEIDVRVIAATNCDLDRAVRDGRFREDLYYRLNVLHLHVPPLRERREDIEALALAQFQRFNAEHRGHARGFSDEALGCMLEHSWPGNVRELINRVRRAMVMAEGRLIMPEDLGLERRRRLEARRPLRAARVQADIEAIAAALRHARYNLSMAARDLGISRVTLYRLMEKYAIPLPAPAPRDRRATDTGAPAAAFGSYRWRGGT